MNNPSATTLESPEEPLSAKAFADAEVNANLSLEDKQTFYQDMVRIRQFEERTIRAYQEGKIGGFCHTYTGQESVAVGTLSILGPGDHIITGYRDHAHALLRGVSMKAAMAELYGKRTGCSKGKGGSMHFFAPDHNFWGGHGIVAGQVPMGVGIGFALKYRGKKSCCLCFLGDGAVNQGSFYESLNLAALWDIPVVFIIENNRYSMGTSQKRSSAGHSLARRALGFDMEHETVQAHLLYAVRAKTAEAVQRACSESRPTLLEMKTYRYRGHSMSDPDHTYRTKEEIEAYKHSQDPIGLYEDLLLEEGILDTGKVKEIKKTIKGEVEAAVRFAEESPFPNHEELTQDVYWEEDNPDHKTSKGTLFFNKP